MIAILDWIFEGIANWMASIITQLMDAVSGVFLNALGTDMTAMEEYFPFVSRAFEIMQYFAWALLFIVTVWQLFRAFGGPITEAENPWHLIARGSIFALLIAYAKPIFMFLLDIARAPYTALMDASMNPGDFTFAGIEQTLSNGLVTLVSAITIVGLLLMLILMISLGWNYFKLLLEVVERYVVVGVLCYTSPLAFAMGGSKATNQVFKSWCRMVGSQLLLLVLNVWFLRAFNSSVGQFVASGGALTSGAGNIFLWMFCALAFLKTAQKFDTYLASMGLSVAQTGSGMGMEMMMAARMLGGFGGSASRSAGSVFRGGAASATGAAGAAGGFAAGFASRFKVGSYVHDAVVEGGARMGAGGGIGLVGRAFGGMYARGGGTLNSESISAVASGLPNTSGRVAGDIADRSLGNYMPQFADSKLSGTQISGGQISTTAIGAGGKEASVEMYNAAQFEKPSSPHSVVSASDGSQWYQMANGDGMGAFYQTPSFSGDASEAAQVASTFPDSSDGTMLRTVDEGVIEASSGAGNSLWYNSAFYQEPDAPHDIVSSADGVGWYAMQPHAEAPQFEPGDAALEYNQAHFQQFMPGYGESVSKIDSDRAQEGYIEVRHGDGSGTAFYDRTQYQAPRGDYQVYEDARGGQWYAIPGTPAVDRQPVYENGKPVYENGSVKSVNVESVRYKTSLTRFAEPAKRGPGDSKPPRRK